MNNTNKAVAKTDRLPRWKDCLAFAILGLTQTVVLLLSKGADAAVWFGIRWGGIVVLLLVVTAIRQRPAARRR
ncbi:hypothetical protein [Burkholderia ambifaria]|uniref:hypothetical protein n=1 Tax=Burkholderia ambifaria TaxID=152480 RepID=UPI0015897B37|nr:hypothetical protein [Burkholderia ambifaria]